MAKKFRFRRVEWQAQVDLFNALNSNVVVDQVQTFGSSLDQPLKVLQGRMVSFGTQLQF